MALEKLIPFDQAAAHFALLRAQGKKIVQCHGTFDLVHPGHLIHFEEARALGDLLVVTLTGEAHVNKGPGRPYFNDQMRAKWLTALECIDYVVVVPHPAAVEAIDCVQPHVYCKGREYADPAHDVTGNILDDVAAVRRHGGTIAYVGSVVFSSSRLINNHFEGQTEDVKTCCRHVAAICPPDEFRRTIDSLATLRVLIVGDLIFDRYTTVEVQGLTSKSRILSGRFVAEDLQAGGSLAVYRHIREFTPHVKLVSLAGAEPWLEPVLESFIPPADADIVRSPKFTTVVKQRFVEPSAPGKELSKLFSVNLIDKYHPGPDLQQLVLDRVARQIGEFDLVLAMDFGHGLLEEPVRNCVQEKAKFLAVNCQTNSNNHGFNILNRRYRRADSFSLDQTEITLAVGRRQFDFRTELDSLAKTLGSRMAWLTRGATETLAWQRGGAISACSPFERNIVDSLGAGDAFCALTALAAARALPLEVATFMGQLAGAQAVKIIGNAEPIRKANFLKSAASMLAF